MNRFVIIRLIGLSTLIMVSVIYASSCSSLRATFGGYTDHFSTCFNYEGQWSRWQRHYFPHDRYDSYDNWRISCEFSPEKHIIGLSLSDSGHNVYYSFIITDYSKGKKLCSGIVEYYVNDKYPTANALAKADLFVRPNPRIDETPSVKRTAKAVIKIVNEGKKPSTFNIWYDGIGVAFDVTDVYWFDD